MCVSLCPLRGPWRSSRSFLWLLCRALPRCDLCGDLTKEDLVLRSQPPHPLRAPLLHDPAGLPAPCQLGGEDQPGWGIIRGEWRRTGVRDGVTMRRVRYEKMEYERCICFKIKYMSCCILLLPCECMGLFHSSTHNLSLSTLLENLQSAMQSFCAVSGGLRWRDREKTDRKGSREDEKD